MAKKSTRGTAYAPGGPKEVYGRLNIAYEEKKRIKDIGVDTLDYSGDMVGENSTSQEDMSDIREAMSLFLSEEPSKGEVSDINNLIDSHEGNIGKLREELDELLESGDKVGLMEFAADTAHNKEYQDILVTEDHYRIVYEDKKSEFAEKSAILTKKIDKGDTEYEDVGDIYTSAQEAAHAFEVTDATRKMTDDYTALIAEAVDNSYTLEDDDSITMFTGGVLGNNDSIEGEYHESGTRPWLEYRQGGMGGSDIGAMADKESAYYAQNMDEIWKSKTEDITDEQVEEQSEAHGGGYDTATGKGNALEDMIGALYAQKYPDMKVLHNKSTWLHNEDGSHVRINYDFMLQRGDKVDGTLEIKTASNPKKWGDVSEGLDGVPANYRAQALAQAEAGGFSHGAVAVLINGHDFRVYEFDYTDDLKAESQENIRRANELYEAAQKAKATGNTESPYVKKTGPTRKGFPKTAFTKGLAGEKAKVFKQVANLRGNGTTPEDVKEEFLRNVPSNKEDWNQDNISSALTGLYKNSQTPGRIVTGIDLETTGLKSGAGERIVELGVSQFDLGTGQEVGKIDELYGVGKTRQFTGNIGPTEITGITMDKIEGKKQFHNPGDASQEYLLNEMKKTGLLVAHNKTYERSMLRGQLKGFAEAELSGEISFFDTMDVAKKMMTAEQAPNNTLQSLVESQGMEYVDAHRAYSDTKMMMDAFSSWQRS